MNKTSKKNNNSSNNKISKDVHEFLMSTIKENNIVILLFITPLFIHFFNSVTYLKSFLYITSLIGFLIFSNKWKSLTSNIIILLLIFITLIYLFNISITTLTFGNFLSLLLIYLLWLSIILIFAIKLNFQNYKKDRVVNKLPNLLQKLHTPSNAAIKFLNKLKPVYSIFMYFVVTISTIVIYSNIYKLQQQFTDNIDSYYFSAVTYFTVGYGEITPQTYNMKILTMSEMLCSSVINVIFIPLIISLYFSYISERSHNTNTK